MSEIYIKLLSDEAIGTIKGNLDIFTKIVKDNPTDNTAFLNELPSSPFVEKKYVIEDFVLSTSLSGNYAEVDLENAVLLYNRLNHLPKYILGDERFWAWVILEKGYAAAIQAMPMESGKNIIKSHWFFGDGKRRGLMFGVLSRAYYRVQLTLDESLDDPYELTTFATEKYERYRNLTWRTYASNKNIVIGTLRAEKNMILKYGEGIEKISNYYTEIGKFVSQMGSVMLLDCMSREYIIGRVEEKCEEMVENSRIAI